MLNHSQTIWNLWTILPNQSKSKESEIVTYLKVEQLSETITQKPSLLYDFPWMPQYQIHNLLINTIKKDIRVCTKKYGQKTELKSNPWSPTTKLEIPNSIRPPTRVKNPWTKVVWGRYRNRTSFSPKIILQFGGKIIEDLLPKQKILKITPTSEDREILHKLIMQSKEVKKKQ